MRNDGLWETDEELATALRDAAGPGAAGPAGVGMIDGERIFCAALDGSNAASAAPSAESFEVCVACLGKIFTATAVAEAVCAGQLDLDLPLDRLRYVPVVARGVFQGITLRHLLSHTHGLDAYGVLRLPVSADGLIDLVELAAMLAPCPRLAVPGELYSYSNVGAWIAAGVLEHRFAASYAQILRSRVLDPLGIPLSMASQCATHVQAAMECSPAVGGRAVLKLPDMMRFLQFHLRRNPQEGRASAAQLMVERTVPMPGWADECGMGLGWKSYDCGWFGHSANTPTCSALVRIHPTRKLAFLTSTRGRTSFLLHTQLFGKLLPTSRVLLPWRASRPAAAVPVEAQRYLGTYGNRAHRLAICSEGPSALVVRSAAGSAASSSVPLKAVHDHTFVLRLAGRHEGTWLQFIRPDDAGFQFIWNGRELFRRLPAQRA